MIINTVIFRILPVLSFHAMNYFKINILVIDDDSSARRIITRLIKQIGFDNFSEAENGQQAFKMLKEDHFGLKKPKANSHNGSRG